MSTTEYLHRPLDEEVTAIGGSYRLVKEELLDGDGRQVLYIVGHGVFDTTCCGAGGCGYALVPGFVVSWISSTTVSPCPSSSRSRTNRPAARCLA